MIFVVTHARDVKAAFRTYLETAAFLKRRKQTLPKLDHYEVSVVSGSKAPAADPEVWKIVSAQEFLAEIEAAA